MVKAAQQTSWTTATEEIKSKRYTYARLQRMGAYLTLGITKMYYKTPWKKAHNMLDY